MLQHEKQCCLSQIFQNSSIILLHWLDKLANFDQFQKPSKPIFTKLSNRVALRNGPNKMAASSSGQLERTVPITRPDLIISGLCVCLCVRVCVCDEPRTRSVRIIELHTCLPRRRWASSCCLAGYTLGKMCTHKSRAALFAELSKRVGTFFSSTVLRCRKFELTIIVVVVVVGDDISFYDRIPPPLFHVSQTI